MIDLCVLQDTCHELFCVFGVFYSPGTQDTEVTKSLHTEYATYKLYIRTIGSLRSDDGDGKGNATKAIGLISKTTILHVHHAFLYISLPSLHDYDVKMPNFPMYRRSTQATTKFPLSL